MAQEGPVKPLTMPWTKTTKQSWWTLRRLDKDAAFGANKITTTNTSVNDLYFAEKTPENCWTSSAL